MLAMQEMVESQETLCFQQRSTRYRSHIHVTSVHSIFFYAGVTMTHEALLEEYRKMLDRWSSGQLFYHFQSFIKRYAKRGWVRSKWIHQLVCSVLALARLGFPINTASVAYLIDANPQKAYFGLIYLSSYGVLDPVDLNIGSRARHYKLSSQFIEYVYKKLVDLK